MQGSGILFEGALGMYEKNCRRIPERDPELRKIAKGQDSDACLKHKMHGELRGRVECYWSGCVRIIAPRSKILLEFGP